MQKLGEYIVNKREELGLSQKELADLAKISIRQLSFIETGRTPQPRKETLKKLSKVLNVDYFELLEISGYPAVSKVLLQANKDKNSELLYYEDPETGKIPIFKNLIQETVLATMDAMQSHNHRIKESHSIYNLPGVKKVSPSPLPHKVPLISKINCGDTVAIALATDSTEYIDCPAIAGKADFAFTVKGNSMENYGIYDGDLVYCKETPEFFSGQTVVLSVQENGESFLVCKKAINKTFVNGRGEIFECEDRFSYGKCNCRIVGVVLAVLGKPL